MHSLRELQLGVMRAVLDGEPDAAAPLIVSAVIDAGQRLAVYANTARGNFTESLILSFPVLRRLVGEEYFRQCAHGFQSRHPSRSGDLQLAGAGFAPYLAHLHGEGEYRYLGDVARFEWLIQETLLAADHPCIDLAKLQTVAPADHDELIFHLHPSARLFTSQFPCAAIWEANGGEAEPPLIDLGTGPDRVLLLRVRGHLEFHRLSLSELGFLASLRAHECFAAAIARATEESARSDVERSADASGGVFDAAAALRRFVLAGLIIDFH